MSLMERIGKRFWGRRAKRIYTVLLVLFALFNIVIFFVVPPVARSIASRKATEALSRKVTIEKISVNPYALSLTVAGLRIGEREGTDEFVSVKRIYVNAQLASVWKLAPVLSAVHVDDPAIHIVRTGPMTFNFSDLLNRPKEPKPPSEPMKFSVNDIQVRGGKVAITDNTTGAEHLIDQILLSIPSVSNFPYYIETDIQPAFSCVFDGSSVALTGQSKPFAESLQTTLDLKVADFELPRYMRDVPIPINFRIDSGRVNCDFHLAYTQYKEVQPSLVLSGNIALLDFLLNDKEGRQILKLPEFRISQLMVRPLKREVYLKEILVREPELNVARSSDGGINLLALVPALPARGVAEEPAEPAPTVEPAAAPAGTEPAVKAPAFPVALDLDSFRVVAAKVDMKDEPPGGSFHAVLAPIDLECAGISTAEGKRAQYKFSMKTDSNEAVDSTGSFSLNPISANVKFALAGLFLPKYAPYYAQFLRADISDGSVGAEGDAEVSLSGGELRAAYRGRSSLEKLNVADQKTGETLFGLGAVKVEGIEATFPPAALSIQEIAVTQPKINVVRNEDNSINLLLVLPPKEAGAKETPPPGTVAATAVPAEKPPLPTISLGKLTVKDGAFSMRDKSLSPNYATTLDAIEVSLQGFAMDPTKQEKPADFSFHAKQDNQSPISVTGKLLPNPDNLYVDTRVDVQDVQLSPFTPYSGRFIGYTIDKGRLRLDLQYSIRGRALDSQNRILLDQFTLGDRVDSPTATKLPVKFAIALIKDRHGQIKFNVPVSGSLDDPKFKIFPIVVRVLYNLIERAVMSPFAFLTGGGEETNYVEFDYGSAVLKDEAVKKLKTIGEALADHPALRFEIRTETFEKLDGDSLRMQFLEDVLKAEKRRDKLGKAGANVPLAEIQLTAEEREKYLKEVYRSADIPGKPTGFLGTTKDIPSADMEKALLTTIQVTPDDLRRLAYQRAAAVKDYLLTAKATDAEHVLMTEPRQVTAEDAQKALPKAEFTLQTDDSAPGAAFGAPPPAGARADVPRKSSLGKTILYGVGGVVLIGAAFAL